MSFAVRQWFLSIGWLFCVLAIAKHSVADETPKPPRVVKLTLSPSAPGSPALKHSLLIEPQERTPGNAAPLYYQAILAYQDHPTRRKWELAENKSIQKWSEGPCNREVRDELHGWLKELPTDALRYIREATRRERCDFEHRRAELAMARDMEVGIHEIKLWPLARMVRYQARVDIADSKFMDARESLRQLYQMALDASSDPEITAAMRGVSFVSYANEEIVHWIGSEGSPNLYWPLTTIPQPFIDVRPICVRQVRTLETLLAPLKDCETAQRSNEEWLKLIGEVAAETDSQGEVAANSDRIASTAALVKLHFATAKERLVDNGYDVEKLNRIPPAQVVAIYMTRSLREVTDEFLKGVYLPTEQVDPYYKAFDERIGKELDLLGRYHEVLPVARLFMPAVHTALIAQTRVELEFAGLRTLEAIRAHMAETGALPEKLEEIKVVPLPANPITHQPFGYERTETGAMLTIPGLGRVPVKHYELTVGKK